VKTYDNQLERYNETGEQLIEIGIKGSQGHACYQEKGQRVSVTIVAVCIGVKEVRM